MVGGRGGRHGRFVRRVTMLALMLLAGYGAALASADPSVVSATVGPLVGVGIDSVGYVTNTSATRPVSVTREQIGNTLVVTVMPAG